MINACRFRQFVGITTFALITLVGHTSAGAKPPKSAHGKVPRPPATRTSNDAPILSQGKLGQDLFMMVGRGDLAGVKTLLKNGADPNSRNGLLFTPLYIASATGQTDIMDALLAGGAKVDASSPYGTALTFAAEAGSVPAAKLLIARGANINPKRVDNITVLMMASRSNGVDTVNALLQRKADVNSKDTDGATALIFAARAGSLEAGRALLDAGAVVDGADSHGWTPLMYASVNGHVDFVRLLLEKGANPNARNINKRTALLLTAAYGDHPEVIGALLKAGADARAVDGKGRSAYALAAARGHAETASLLKDTVTSSSDNVAGTNLSAKSAVQVSLDTLQHSMLVFNKRTGCVSCHQEGLGRMVTGAALDSGIKVDRATDQLLMARINGGVNALRPLHSAALKDPAAMKQVPLVEIQEVAPGYTWLLAGMAAHKQPANDGTGAMAMVMARQQFPDGHWHFALQRAPMQSSFFTFTALAIRSLRAYGPKAYAGEIAERIGHAKAWMLTAPAESSDDLTFRLLGLKWAGASHAEMQKAIDELRDAQRPDGGWAQVKDLQSDAYATGEALYALHTAGGLPVNDPVYQRGVHLLLATQDDDGSWFINKRAMPANNYFDGGFPHGESQYASFNGTCWATMALLQTIQQPQRQARR